MSSITDKASPQDSDTDVIELCAILQCLGFQVRSMDTSGVNVSQDGGTKTVVVNCQSSGLHVVLENTGPICSCPLSSQEGGSGFWQMSAVSGGRQHDKEFGSSLLGNYPKVFRDRLTSELKEIVRNIRHQKEEQDDKDLSHLEGRIENKSSSMVELKSTPEQRLQIKMDTPTRYRSLDALISNTDEYDLPAPKPLLKHGDGSNKAMGCTRQGTYTLSRRQSIYTTSSTSGSCHKRNKTSSPIQVSTKNNLIDKLIMAERTAEDLWSQLSNIINEVAEEPTHHSSISSLALDVSKISVLKITEPAKNQFASSPNLTRLPSNSDDLASKIKLKRMDSASTSNLTNTKTSTNKNIEITSRLRKLSPSFFKSKQGTSGVVKENKSSPRLVDSKGSKLTNLLKSRAKIAVPVRTPKQSTASPDLSSTKKKFSHIKSTIPKPTPKKE